MGSPDEQGESVRFQTRLQAGETELQTWFFDREGKPLCGAYYVYVERR